MLLKLIICLGIVDHLVSGDAVKRQDTIYVTLECPVGWRVHGQVWYVPKYSTGDWSSQTWKTSGSDLLSDSFASRDFIDSMMCVICESDLIKDDSNSLISRLEICSYNPLQALMPELEYERQHCMLQNNLKWCSDRYARSLNVPVARTSLQNAVGNTSATTCSDASNTNLKLDPKSASNSYSQISMTCPKDSVLKSIENRWVPCIASKVSFCIVCSSAYAEFSVCLSKCVRILEAARINGLVVANSTRKLSDQPRMCGVTIDANVTLGNASLYPDITQGNLIMCKRDQTKETYNKVTDFKIFIIVVATMSVIIAILLGVIAVLSIKLKAGGREKASDITDKSNDVNVDRDDSNIEMENNPYYI